MIPGHSTKLISTKCVQRYLYYSLFGLKYIFSLGYVLGTKTWSTYYTYEIFKYLNKYWLILRDVTYNFLNSKPKRYYDFKNA